MCVCSAFFTWHIFRRFAAVLSAPQQRKCQLWHEWAWIVYGHASYLCSPRTHTHLHIHRVHMCALNFPCLLLMSNFSVCKFTFFVSVFHFKRIFQIRLTGRKAAVRAEREEEEGEGASWPENCWLLKVLLLRSALFSCKPTRFLPAKSCFAFSTA